MNMAAEFTTEFYLAALPVLILASMCVGILFFPAFKISNPNVVFYYVLAAIGLTAVSVFARGEDASLLGGAYLADSLSGLGQILVLAIAFVIAVLIGETNFRGQFFRTEIAATFLKTLLGMIVMVASEDFITLFVGLELSSIGVYILVGYAKPSRASLEGAVKYFVMGSVASAVLLLGFAFLYIATGSLQLRGMVNGSEIVSDLWLQFGFFFLLVGLLFKLALMPFHSWAPDAYESAPTGITAFLATAMKVVIMVVVLRITEGIAFFEDQWAPTLLVVSSLSIIAGNVMALAQSSIKRMLAYSSIAHSGYMAIALCAIGYRAGFTYQSILFYLLGYILTSLLAFGTLMWLEDEEHPNLHVDDLSGLVTRHPWAALSMAVAMFSFAGLPPAVGFFGKFFVFNVALKEGLYTLVFIGVGGSLVSLFYYLRVIVHMYMYPPSGEQLKVQPHSMRLGSLLAASCVAIVLLGTVLPGKTLELLRPIAMSLASDP